jgi:hypothetical protein
VSVQEVMNQLEHTAIEVGRIRIDYQKLESHRRGQPSGSRASQPASHADGLG